MGASTSSASSSSRNESSLKDSDGSSQEKILMEPYSYILQVPGKQVREKLIHAFNFWLKISDEKLHVIADVVKMLHNSSLLIDDIEDNSNLRRGMPVAHKIYGVAHTINSANYVYFKALERVVSLNHPECINIFTEELLELHRGQGMDIYWRDSYTCPTEEEYKEMVQRKTGGLFRLAVKLMQTFSENKSNFVPLLDTLALFFQIRDDYANLLSEEYKENKSFCEDLTEGKFSFPIIHGIRNDSNSTRLMNILKQRTTDVDIKKYFVDHLEQAPFVPLTVQAGDNAILKQVIPCPSQGHTRRVVTLGLRVISPKREFARFKHKRFNQESITQELVHSLTQKWFSKNWKTTMVSETMTCNTCSFHPPTEEGIRMDFDIFVAQGLIASLGGNPHLSAVVVQLAKLYS